MTHNDRFELDVRQTRDASKERDAQPKVSTIAFDNTAEHERSRETRKTQLDRVSEIEDGGSYRSGVSMKGDLDLERGDVHAV